VLAIAAVLAAEDKTTLTSDRGTTARKNLGWATRSAAITCGDANERGAADSTSVQMRAAVDVRSNAHGRRPADEHLPCGIGREPFDLPRVDRQIQREALAAEVTWASPQSAIRRLPLRECGAPLVLLQVWRHTQAVNAHTADDAELEWDDVPQELIGLTDRANAAGLDSVWLRWRDHPESPPWLELKLPSGRDTYAFHVRAEQGEALARYRFEAWTVLRGYRAVLDRHTREILAEIDQTTVMGWASKIPGVVSEPDPTPSYLDRRARLVLPGPRESNISLEEGYPSQLDPLYGRHVGTFLRISGVGCEKHDDALEVLTTLTAALFFEIDLSYGVTMRLAPAFDPERYAHRTEVALPNGAPTFPSRVYPKGPVSLYLHAGSYQHGFTTLPLPQFLAYYQVIEHFLPMYSRREALRRFRLALKDPTINPDDDVAVGRLVAIAAEGGRNLSEREQLRMTIEACCDVVQLGEFITGDAERAKFLAGPKNLTGIRPVHVGEKVGELCEQVAERLYGIRCRIVHTKDGLVGISSPLLPFDDEAKRLGHDIALVRFVAQRVIIASSSART
jgi:hypothetical protein